MPVFGRPRTLQRDFSTGSTSRTCLTAATGHYNHESGAERCVNGFPKVSSEWAMSPWNTALTNPAG